MKVTYRLLFQKINPIMNRKNVLDNYKNNIEKSMITGFTSFFCSSKTEKDFVYNTCSLFFPNFGMTFAILRSKTLQLEEE